MNNLPTVFEAMADVFAAEAPLGIAIISIVFSFSLVSHLFRFICCNSREMHQIKRDVDKCKETISELEKKYPPICPCDFHTSCDDCRLVGTAYCWKVFQKWSEKENER